MRAARSSGDILGALTGEGGIAGTDFGKIQLSEQYSSKAELKRLQEGKIKGRSYRARKLG